MLLFSGTLGVLALLVWIFCVIDAITSPPDQVRNLPKFAWIVIVILLVEIGALAWLVAGRPWGAARANGLFGSGGSDSGRRSGRFADARTPAARPSNPDDDEEFLATLQARAEEQRRRAREASGEDDHGASGSTP